MTFKDVGFSCYVVFMFYLSQILGTIIVEMCFVFSQDVRAEL